MKATALVEILKGLIERSYGMPRVIGDVAPFIVGDVGFRSLYGGHAGPHSQGGEGARVLVRDTGRCLRASLYYPDALVSHLETHNPLAGVGDVNIDAFAVLEELDHLLTLASRAAEKRPVSLLELEHHANVTKYLVVVHFLTRQSGRARLAEAYRVWARHHIFEKYAAGGGEEGTRYRRAAALAHKYVMYLESIPSSRRHAELRAFQARSFSQTLLLAQRSN
jgi:hypothetical protein